MPFGFVPFASSLLAGGCGGWLKGLKRLKIKKHSMNIYGAFFIFDEGNIVMFFNGFQKVICLVFGVFH